MTFIQIATAIENNKKVYWGKVNYEVIKSCNSKGNFIEYLIHSKFNDNYVGLTGTNNTLNEKEKDFFL